MIKAVFFDFDGTLADTLPYYIKAYDKALQTIGFHLNEKEIAKICFGKKENIICDSLGVSGKTKEFSLAHFKAVKNLFKNAPLFEDAVSTLNFLKDHNIKIIIITFAYRWYIDQMIKQYKLEKYFDFIISTDDVINTKPHPEAVLKAVDRLKIKPEETLVIGDSKNDILMGKSAGSKTILFTRKEYNLFYSFNELKKTNPTYIISNLNKLKKLIF